MNDIKVKNTCWPRGNLRIFCLIGLRTEGRTSMNKPIIQVRYWLLLAALLLPQNLWPAQAVDLNAARKEGKLTIYASISLDDINILARAFEKKYPWIQVTTYRAGKINLGQRMVTEGARAGILSMFCFPAPSQPWK